jgi:hypothetical protein
MLVEAKILLGIITAGSCEELIALYPFLRPYKMGWRQKIEIAKILKNMSQ